jgi:hypothetical protein
MIRRWDWLKAGTVGGMLAAELGQRIGAAAVSALSQAATVSDAASAKQEPNCPRLPARPSCRPGPRTHSPHRTGSMSLLPGHSLQFTILVEYAQTMVSVRNEQATAARRGDWYWADPRAYLRIAAVLRERIIAGELVPGHAAPSITRLCADHGVARQTAAHALHVLQDAGLVYRVPGLGYHVCNDILSGQCEPGGQLPAREPVSEETLPPGTELCPLLSARVGCRPEFITW